MGDVDGAKGETLLRIDEADAIAPKVAADWSQVPVHGAPHQRR